MTTAPTVPGVDVSAHQGPSIDWRAVAGAGFRFAILRALEGKDTDATFERNRREARAAGLLVGAYVYFRARHPGDWQARRLLELLGDQLDGELPPVVDIEELDGRPAVTVREQLAAWIEVVRDAIGRDPIVYTGPAFWSAQLHGEQLVGAEACPLWIADYRERPAPQVPAPWKEARLWQHSGSGKVPGVPGQCDLNRWLGGEASLQAFARGACEPLLIRRRGAILEASRWADARGPA